MHRIALAAALMLSSAAMAQDAAPDIMKNAINTPSVGYTIYGPNQSAKLVKDDGLPGGQALQVTVSATTPNAWDIGANNTIDKPITKGDRLVVAVWLRAPKLGAGETLPIHAFQVNQKGPPYATVVTGSGDITNAWKLYQARGTAPASYAAGEAVISVHLGAARGVVALGPAFVLDFGPAPAKPAG